MDFSKLLSSVDYTKYYELTINWLILSIPKIFGALIILYLGFKIINIIENTIGKILDRQKINPMLKSFIISLSNIILKVIIIIVAAGVVGVQTSSFVAMLAAAGFAIGMALSGTLQNFAGGVMILLLKPFKIGDYIEVGSYIGHVKEINIFNTILTTNDKKKVIIPNSDISNGSMVNYSSEANRRIDMYIGVSYSDDIDFVKETLLEIAKNEPKVLQDKSITIGLNEFGDNSVNFHYRVFVKSSDYWPAKFSIMEEVKRTFDKKGISFPFPQRDVHLYNEK